MRNQSAYSQLLEHQQKSIALSQVQGLIAWDQETMMPKDGAGARAEQMSAMASVLHAMSCDPRHEDWLGEIDEASLDAVARANVREARRGYERATKIPARLASELAKTSALAHGIWAQAKQAEDVAAFLPCLKEIVALKREEAACLSVNGQPLYDALLDDYEPGMKTDALSDLLGKLRERLVALRPVALENFKDAPVITGSFSDDQQMEMARRLAEVFNYSFSGGRIDKSVHPFSSGYRSDSRITTRTDPDNVLDCMYSTVHEVGHSNYEQGRDPSMDRTAAGGYASMGIHESQSRMLENQIGRSRAFMEWLYPQMREVFGDIGLDGPEALYRAINKVETGFIRTEADEVHYNLHVLLRFDLELAMINDDLQVEELEAAWNSRFEADFGRKVEKPSQGVLQDVHWAGASFGYFPTYSLGNIYAGELYHSMRAKISDMDEKVARGDLAEIGSWLGDNIHRHGHVLSAPQLMEKAIGKTPTEGALADYLDSKFS